MLPEPPETLTKEEREACCMANLMFSTRREPEQLALTLAAMATIEEIGRLQILLAEQGDMVPGPRGRNVPNPLFAELRSHRALLAKLLDQTHDRPKDEKPDGTEPAHLGPTARSREVGTARGRLVIRRSVFRFSEFWNPYTLRESPPLALLFGTILKPKTPGGVS